MLASSKCCAACGTAGVGLRCSLCRAVHYCNVACQTAHWTAAHDKTCSQRVDLEQLVAVCAEAVGPRRTSSGRWAVAFNDLYWRDYAGSVADLLDPVGPPCVYDAHKFGQQDDTFQRPAGSATLPAAYAHMAEMTVAPCDAPRTPDSVLCSLADYWRATTVNHGSTLNDTFLACALALVKRHRCSLRVRGETVETSGAFMVQVQFPFHPVLPVYRATAGETTRPLFVDAAQTNRHSMAYFDTHTERRHLFDFAIAQYGVLRSDFAFLDKSGEDELAAMRKQMREGLPVLHLAEKDDDALRASLRTKGLRPGNSWPLDWSPRLAAARTLAQLTNSTNGTHSLDSASVDDVPRPMRLLYAHWMSAIAQSGIARLIV